MKTPFSNLRLRTRLALVMFLTMASTSGILITTYVRQEERVKAYVAGVTSDLVAISELTRAQQSFPAKADPKMILQAYTDALQKNGLHVDATSPSGEVLASSDPKQLHKKIKIRGRAVKGKENPIQISASFQDIEVDPGAGQATYSVQFPIVHGDKVIGYMVLHGVADQAGPLLRRSYLNRSAWILATLLVGMFAVVYLAFLFTKPVDQLVTGAEQVAQGNLYVSLPAAGSGEMGRLAKTFNAMVERLRENRQLLERLNEAEKLSLLGRFAATVAHEVRNSLNFINLSIDQIRARHLGGDERAGRDLERNLDNVKDEVSRMNRLVNEFLTAGRQSPPALAPCDLRATVEEAVSLVEKQARLQGIEIASELPADLPTLQADAGQMKTCFLNILTNAIQAMPQGGEVRISAALLPAKPGFRPNGANKTGALQLRFADTGPGIQPADRQKIFAPYFSTKTTGFGLGLAISKKIVEDHGGRIYPAEAPTVGVSGGTNGHARGTVMVVELPLREDSGNQPSEAGVKTSDIDVGKGKEA
ncbi:MAG TPA: ATP-binding protein [Terriglobia bacterium]|nr:ATP-binding protein [Terriglobia bacterium]